jgi:hypothetical protein
LPGEVRERERADGGVRVVSAFFGSDEPAGRGGQSGLRCAGAGSVIGWMIWELGT